MRLNQEYVATFDSFLWTLIVAIVSIFQDSSSWLEGEHT